MAMDDAGKPASDALSTLTHARLRAAQGDVRGARRVLDRILAEHPGDAAARRLRAELDSRSDRARVAAAEPPLPPPQAASAERLAARFREALVAPRDARRRDRVARLERWLRRVTRQREKGP